MNVLKEVESENKIYILYKKRETQVIIQITLFHLYPLGMVFRLLYSPGLFFLNFFLKCTVLHMVDILLIIHTEAELHNSNLIAEGNTQ